MALKVLPAEMAQDPERLGRFRREAKTLAQLDHPNIVTIYSVEECDGVHFLTMQLVEGQPLDRLIPQAAFLSNRSSRLPAPWAMRWRRHTRKASCIATSSPPMSWSRTEGRVKVLDFGWQKTSGLPILAMPR